MRHYDSDHAHLLLTVIIGRSQVYMALRISEPTSISLWRSAQQDTSIALRFRAIANNAATVAEQLLAQSRTNGTAWKYVFATVDELHVFQKCLTGAEVVFDGTVSSFRVTRGNGLRTKKEDFGVARLQLLHDGSAQLWEILAFFEDGQAMNFVVDAGDVFERSSSKGKYSIKLFEAKVSLPVEGDDNEKRGFLCVEDVSEGEERDDITMTFDSEDAWEVLTRVLPSSVKKTTSLMGALHLR
jgi:hypothetical protein